MTAKITDLTAALMTNAVNPVVSSATTAVKTDGNANGFSDVLDVATDKLQSSKEISDSSISSQKPSNDAKEAFDKSLSKEIDSKDVSGKDPVNNNEDKMELVKTATLEGNEIAEEIKKTLDVSDEEIADAMQALGITVVDLLNPQNVQALCMELKGIEDSISLLMDEELYGNVKMLCNMADEAGETISEQFGIDRNSLSEIAGDGDFFKEVLAALESEKGESATVDTTTGIISQNDVDDFVPAENINPADVNGETATEGNAYVYVTSETNIVDFENGSEVSAHQDVLENASAVQETENVPTVKVTVTNEGNASTGVASTQESLTEGKEESSTEESSTNSVTETLKNEAKSEGANLRGRNEGFENASRFSENTEQVTPSVTTVTQTEVNSVGDIVETVSHYTSTDGNEILSQVTESIKVNYSPDTTSMEMQLHPASLGTVNMHISSSNGIVTAHIVVENEAVKAALESQLITLQETFEASGQKVEAVDVSVAGYDLNRGMNSETGNNSQGNSEETFRRSGVRRRINLNDLSADDLEEMSEEEMIAADMMARSGNSVDFMA